MSNKTAVLTVKVFLEGDCIPEGRIVDRLEKAIGYGGLEPMMALDSIVNWSVEGYVEEGWNE